jgi:hypothetical protein
MTDTTASNRVDGSVNVGVKSAVTRTRVKRVRSNEEFDAFTRRILRAYARRVASGDVEALRSMVTLSTEVDAVITLAVLGLRQIPFSWAEIAERLGTSRQAAQMRYGERAERYTLDRRLVEAGLGVTVPTLVAVFRDHHPGIPAASSCPGCGFIYPAGVTDCPTNATVRPLLYRRRAEDKKAFNRLTPDQYADLHKTKPRNSRVPVDVRSARSAAPPAHMAPQLFAVNGSGLNGFALTGSLNGKEVQQ